MRHVPLGRWTPPARTEAEERLAETDAARISDAALLGAALATEDLFRVDVPAEQEHLVRRGDDPDDPEPTILSSVAWSVRQKIAHGIRAGEPVGPRKAYRAVRDARLRRGPVRTSQLPRTLPADRAAGTDLVAALEAEWRRQVAALLEEGWEPLRAGFKQRTRTVHPLVRIAFLARGDHDPWEHHTLLGLRHITCHDTVTGAYAVSALVHPNEAEAMLDAWDELQQGFRLLPSEGVSRARIETAMRLRAGAYVKGEDAPMRPLVQALVAAADVLGEPVLSEEPAPTVQETTADLAALCASDPRARGGTRPQRPVTARWTAWGA